MSDSYLRKILYVEFFFYSYKMMIVQEFKKSYWWNHRGSSEVILEMVQTDVAVLFRDNEHIQWLDLFYKQNIWYKLKTDLYKFTCDFWAMRVLSFGLEGNLILWNNDFWRRKHSVTYILLFYREVIQLPWSWTQQTKKFATEILKNVTFTNTMAYRKVLDVIF